MTAPAPTPAIPLPFGAVFVAESGSRQLSLPPSMRNTSTASPYMLELPAGVNQVVVTWAGAESLAIQRRATGVAVSTVHTIKVDPSATERRSGVLMISGATPILINLTTGQDPSAVTLAMQGPASVQVIPMGLPTRP